jgi:hypothetical protein
MESPLPSRARDRSPRWSEIHQRRVLFRTAGEKVAANGSLVLTFLCSAVQLEVARPSPWEETEFEEREGTEDTERALKHGDTETRRF